MTSVDPELPLAGVRVADFSTVMAGPMCTKLLASLGADVVKIEPPAGDYTRGAAPLRGGSSAYFAELNNGKRSVVLDLRHPDARTAALALVDRSEIVVENMRVGTMAKYGLDYETLVAHRPELVYCSITGFGQGSPNARRPATAQIIHAAVGYDRAFASYQQGEVPPPATGLYAADGLAGAHAVTGILAALRVRDRTGRGAHVDVALDHALLSMMTYEIATAQFPPGFTRKGYRPVRARDGYVMVAAVTERNFEALCAVLDRFDLRTDPRFARTADRWRAYDALHAVIEEWSLCRTASECADAFLAAGVPATTYQSVEEYLGDRDVHDRVLVPAKDDAGELHVTALPFRLGGHTRAGPRVPVSVPALGADTRDILIEVLGSEEAERLIASGAAQ